MSQVGQIDKKHNHFKHIYFAINTTIKLSLHFIKTIVV